MSVFGSLVGVQEGIEAGLVTGGLVAGEQHTSQTIAVGLGAAAIGVLGGHQFGDSSLTLIDRIIGDGGIGFIPGMAIGLSVMWHNWRPNAPQQSESVKSVAGSLPYLLAGAGYAAFEGVESGILTSTAQTSLVSAEAVTLAAAGATIAIFSGFKALVSHLSPRNVLRAARGIALAPAIGLGAKATPELVSHPKVMGVGIAVLGSTAVCGAVSSFFVNKPEKANPRKLLH